MKRDSKNPPLQNPTDEIWSGPLGDLNTVGGPPLDSHMGAIPPHLGGSPLRHSHHLNRPPHPPHRHPHHFHGNGAFALGNEFSSMACSTLYQIVEPSVANWMMRAISFGPPEMLAIFKVQIATMSHTVEMLGAVIEITSPADIQSGDLTIAALSIALNSTETGGCVANLFYGPEEVQVIAFASLINVRLASIHKRIAGAAAQSISPVTL